MSDPRTQSAVTTEAADWYARLRADNVSEFDAVRFRAWIAADPERRREFEAIDAFWGDLDVFEQSQEVLRVREAIDARRRRAKKVWGRGPWAFAAMLLVVIGGALLAWQQWDVGRHRYVTDIGELRTVPLPDGSIITLNTATEVRLDYSEARRGVELVRGQANFEVAKVPSRPFIVSAGGREVRALGTVFDVYKASDKVTVTLIEGKVAVSPKGRASFEQSLDSTLKESVGSAETEVASLSVSGKLAEATEIILAAGEQLTYIAAAGTLERAAADVQRATAWRARKLDFSDTPLLEAIAEANRYSRERIVLDAPGLEDARISGTFEAGKNELFAEGSQAYFGLHVERAGDHRIILTRRPD